jgi:hypothetical protein
LVTFAGRLPGDRPIPSVPGDSGQARPDSRRCGTACLEGHSRQIRTEVVDDLGGCAEEAIDVVLEDTERRRWFFSACRLRGCGLGELVRAQLVVFADEAGLVRPGWTI